MEDDGGGGIEREEDYDALNDETFGSAINGDWEDIHENLVLLDTNGNTNGRNKDEADDGDLGDLGTNAFTAFTMTCSIRLTLIFSVSIWFRFIFPVADFNLARVGLEDCEEVDDDNEIRVQLDPSVWAVHPLKSNEQNTGLNNQFNQPDAFIRQNFPNPFHPQLNEQIQQQHQHQQQMQMQILQHQRLQLQQQQQQQQQSVQMVNFPADGNNWLNKCDQIELNFLFFLFLVCGAV